MANVLELVLLDLSWTRRLGWVDSFERLHAGLLVGTDDMSPRLREFGCLPIDVTDRLDILIELLAVLKLVLRGQPIAALVGAEVDLDKKRSTWRGEIESTMPRLMASRASSGGVQ